MTIQFFICQTKLDGEKKIAMYSAKYYITVFTFFQTTLQMASCPTKERGRFIPFSAIQSMCLSHLDQFQNA